VLDWAHKILSHDLAIDLGTASTLVYVRGVGIVANEPSVVAVQPDPRGSRKLLAVGRAAEEMLDRAPSEIAVVRPLRRGVIADFEITAAFVKHLVHATQDRRSLVKPRIIVGVPTGTTEVERRAVREAVEAAGAREVFLIQQPLAAAMGAGLPVADPSGSMIVDIGGGTSEMAVVSVGGIVLSRSVRVAGDAMDQAIVQHVRRTRNLLIGERMAELVKLAIGTACPTEDEPSMMVRGRDLLAGIPRVLAVTASEVREAISEPLHTIVEAVRATLERTPPELAGDIAERGIVLAGGGALLRNVDLLLQRETGLPVFLAEDPLCAVVLGAGRALEEIDLLRRVAGHA
jgi:rod shape-determining protein MreB